MNMKKQIKISDADISEFNFFLKNVFPHTMKWEGGGKLHNVAGDSGGWTIFGIAWNYNKDYFDSFDEFKNITESEAAKFAFINYYLKISPSNLRRDSKLIAFDIAYNMGVGTAIKYIQSCSGVEADGKIGPKTQSKMGIATPECLQEKRLAYYKSLSQQSKFAKFYNGWVNRAKDIFNITKKN